MHRLLHSQGVISSKINYTQRVLKIKSDESNNVNTQLGLIKKTFIWNWRKHLPNYGLQRVYRSVKRYQIIYNNFFSIMASKKIAIVFALLLVASLCQFSSFVPSYLLKVPTQFISPVVATEPLDNYISFKRPPSFKSVFNVDQTPQQASQITSSICTFPLILLQNTCQCPRKLKFVFGKCIGATPQDYNPTYTGDSNGDQIIQCPLLKINNKFKRNGIEDLAFIQRTYDGANNNLNFPKWGVAGTFLQRRLPANYADDLSEPISHLPNPRVISNAVGSQSNPIRKSRLNVTTAFTIFGQFVDHDLDLTPTQSGASAESMDIQIPPNDQFFNNQKFISFKRSSFLDLNGQARKHSNVVTSWIDGSQIYGSANDTVCALRTFKGGKLKTSRGKNGEELLPLLNGFFRAGDIRAIENSILATYHTIFVRQHNRLCDQILSNNPTFNDETVFQIARNYVIGLLQKIVLKDFVPILLGDKYNDIIGKYKGYRSDLNPNIPTQFSTASYRLGHSLLVNKIPTINQLGQVERSFSLNDLFFKQDLIDEDFIGGIVRGVSRTLAKQKSSQIVDDVRNLLVLDPSNREVKLDLYSLNIQRGRDHGLPTYNDARQAFGLPRISTFPEFLPLLDLPVANKLKSVYGLPDNIELFVGIISERPVKNGILGDLGAEIVGQTFRNLRDGDRLWYERVFPKSVIDQIDNTELGDIFARNTKASDLPSGIFKFNQ